MDATTDDLDAKIAKLQEERERRLAEADRARRQQEEAEARILVGSTPTKKRPKFDEHDFQALSPAGPSSVYALPKSRPASTQSTHRIPSQPSRSTLSASLAALRRSRPSQAGSKKLEIARTECFSRHLNEGNSTAIPSRPVEGEEELEVAPREREEDLTLAANLKLGPQEFGRDPEGRREWLSLEPNTRIRLSERVLPHDQLQDYLYGRYFLSPSLLYSVIRLSKDGATYDVPVEGDWVTIAVVAERGEVKVSGAKDAFSNDEEDNHPDSNGLKQGDKPISKEQLARWKWQKRRGPRKYINFKLCALPPRNKAMTGEIAGDAMLQLLMFESDAKVHGTDGDAAKYRGGSGGAYEKWCNLNVGSVIAILNPRVLRPLRSGGQSPHPLTLPLALNPTSGDGIILIGQSKDLGCCTATTKEGKRCSNWVDLRVNDVCEWHLHAAVQRGRSSRAELASSNGLSPFGLTGSQGQGGGSGARGGKFGLLPRSGARAASRGPDNGSGGTTYVVAGRTVSTGKPGIDVMGNENISEKLGRGRTSRQKRRMEARETEKALSALLEKDSGTVGGSTGGKYLAILRKKTSALGAQPGSQSADEVDDRKRVFGADAIKKIGFDPTAKKTDRTEEDKKKRLASIASLRDSSDRPLKLARPKDLSRSTVRAPPSAPSLDVDDDDDGMIDLD